ncbi:MAG TPA: tetratricopeptide repeat protein [Coleofasciculaceae cyanobacterium]|jgi:tetratricopeptide (TPR) repeat protein
MSQNPIDWNTDLPVDLEDEYRALVRALRRTQGFGLLFVQCSVLEGTHIIGRVKQDLPQKSIAVLQFDQPIADGNFYREVEQFLQNSGNPNILFVQGLEHSLLDYEETKKRLSGWSSEEIYAYSWKGAPRLLMNLNQQRERFRDTFNTCFVFLVPPFLLKYFIERAPDFFDWRSGVFVFPMEIEQLQRESLQIYFNSSKLEDYQKLNSQERRRKILELKNLIDESFQSAEGKADLYFDQALLFELNKEYEAAIAAYDRSLKLDPDRSQVWTGRGNALFALGRDQEASESYGKAAQLKQNLHNPIKASNSGRDQKPLMIIDAPDQNILSDSRAETSNLGNSKAVFSSRQVGDPIFFFERGVELYELNRYADAVEFYDKALKITPDDYTAWNNRGTALSALKRYEEAIASYDQAIQFKPGDHATSHSQNDALPTLGCKEEMITIHNPAIQLKLGNHVTWNNRGDALSALGRYEEAITSYDQAIRFKPDYYFAWNNRGDALFALGCEEEAIASYKKVIESNPDGCIDWYNRGHALFALGNYEEAIANYNQAIRFKPDYYFAWYSRGKALKSLGRYEEAISSYDKSLEFLPEDAGAYYDKACCYGLQGNVEKAIDSLQRAIELDPEYQEQAKTDTDFDSIRERDAFQALVEGL